MQEMPDGVIGSTTDSDSVRLGSSPSRATISWPFSAFACTSFPSGMQRKIIFLLEALFPVAYSHRFQPDSAVKKDFVISGTFCEPVDNKVE